MNVLNCLLTSTLGLVPMLAFSAGNPVEYVTLDELKSKCQELQYQVDHEQLKPFHIDVNCQRERTYWTVEEHKVGLPESQYYAGEANIKGKWFVKPTMELLQRDDSQKTCTVFKEYKVQAVKVSLDIAGCKELAMVDSLPKFCASQLTEGGTGQNPNPGQNLTDGEEDAVATGREINTCQFDVPAPCQPVQQQTVSQDTGSVEGDPSLYCQRNSSQAQSE